MSTHSHDEVLDGRADEPSRLPQDEHKDAPPPKKSNNSNGFLARIQHFTWANYTLPMSTGGLALLLSESTQPHTFPGLQTIGKVIYVFDLCLFALITATLLARFVRYPGTLRASLRHPTEALFVPTFFLALASIIGGIGRYAIPSLPGAAWLVAAYRVLFWVYFSATFGVAVGLYMVLFTSPRLRIEDMTPAWDLPIFPFMLCGTVAAIGASDQQGQPPGQAMPMIVAGLTAQGLGMLVSLLMYACYLRRMVQFGLPSPHSRPAMFIAVGPPGFTAVALLGLAKDYPLHYDYFGDDEVTAQVLKVVATMAGVFLWSLALWFFCLALLACLQTWRHMPFSLGWYAFVFPNVGFTMATINIGEALDSPAAQWVGSAMTLLLVAAYLGVLACHARALARGELVAEGKDEDVYVDELRHAYGKVRFSDEEWHAESPKRD